MWNRHNTHKIFINIEIPKIHHIHEIGSGTKLYYLWVKGYLTWGERHNLSMLTAFTSSAVNPTNARCPEPRSESRLTRSAAGTQLTPFSQIPKSSAHASGTWRHSHHLVLIPICDFYFDISEWHILSARAWTPALMLHLTNPCAKRKVLSLTKPKGKIYKTKSLGNYITHIP